MVDQLSSGRLGTVLDLSLIFVPSAAHVQTPGALNPKSAELHCDLSHLHRRWLLANAVCIFWARQARSVKDP